MRICMYGAGSDSIDDKFKRSTEQLGIELAKHGHSLIYGGGSSGLMGACSKGVAEGGGKVIAVVPHFMHDYETLNDNATVMIKTETMAERKQVMEDNADVFVICPGGIGTLDEFFQTLTLRELDRHHKPIILFNYDGFYAPVMKLIDTYTQMHFIREKVNTLFTSADSIDEIIEQLDSLQP